MAEKFKKEELPPFMKNMAQALKDNGGQWLVGGGRGAQIFDFERLELELGLTPHFCNGHLRYQKY